MRRDPVRVGLLSAAFACLVLVGIAGPSVALPPLPGDGFAPPHLPWTVHPWLIIALQVAGYVLGAAGLWRGYRYPSALGLRAWHLAVIAIVLLMTAPFGTADHTNYAAYGRILALGGDPWAGSPLAYGPDPVIAAIQPPWQDTANLYGPIATALMGLGGLIGGDDTRQIVWVWQAIVVAAWLGVRELLRRVADTESVDLWWTTNILVLGAGVLGAHVDTIAVLAIAAALVAAARHRPLLAGLAVGAAASTKVTSGVIGVALIIGWFVVRRAKGETPPDLPSAGRWIGSLVGGAALVAIPAHLWAGRYVFDRLIEASGGVSYATPWRALYTGLGFVMDESVARAIASRGSAVVCVLLAWWLWKLTEPLLDQASLLAQSARALFVLFVAYALGSAYVLPWYELPQWAALAVIAAIAARDGGHLWRVLIAVLIARGLVLALAYVPGRVTLPHDVEVVTLGFRMVASPLVTVVAWVLIGVLFARARRERQESVTA